MARAQGFEGVRREEAAFYVDQADEDLDLALQELRKDLEWEAQNQHHMHAKVDEAVGGGGGGGDAAGDVYVQGHLCIVNLVAHRAVGSRY